MGKFAQIYYFSCCLPPSMLSVAIQTDCKPTASFSLSLRGFLFLLSCVGLSYRFYFDESALACFMQQMDGFHAARVLLLETAGDPFLCFCVCSFSFCEFLLLPWCIVFLSSILLLQLQRDSLLRAVRLVSMFLCRL